MASANRAQSVVSGLHQVFGNTIEIKADVSGRGYATIGFEAFDGTGYYSWASLRAVEHFHVQLPVGSEIEFDLQEHRNRNLHWSVVRYDGRICRIKVDHDRDGVFPLRYDKAEFELKALYRGKTTIELACGRKKVFIHFTVL